MAELAELVPDLRELMLFDKNGLDDAKNLLKELQPKVGSTSDLFAKIEADVVAKDVLTVGDTSLESLFKDILETGDLEAAFEKLGLDTNGVDRVSDVFKKLTSDIPERKLYELSVEKEVESRILDDILNDIEDVESNPDNLKKNQKIIENNEKLKQLEEEFEKIKSGKTSTTKIIVGGGILVALGATFEEFIRNYIRTKSGAFVVKTVDNKLQESKILNYSCVYPDNATVVHPFDKEIKAYLKGKAVCSDVHEFGNCAGWATIGANSRLSVAKISVAKLGKTTTLLCRKAGLIDAVFDLLETVGKKIADVVANVGGEFLNKIFAFLKQFAPFLSIGVGFVTGGVGYFILNNQKTQWRILVAIFIAIFFSAVFYFVFNSIHF